jgi:beta-glucosidase
VKHYEEVLAELKKQGIEPMVTLFHFTLPVWFAEMGGFEKRANVKFFVEFAERILSELGGTIRYVITINEPEIYASQSYLEAKWPPQVQNRAQYRRVLANLAFAHNTIAKKLHAASRRYRVSVAKNSAYIYPGDDSALSVRAAAVMQYQRDDMFLRKVIKQCDFLGVNYYFSERVYGYRVHNPDERLNDLGWDMQPQYLERALERLSEKYKKPIIVTENGLADASDEDRQWWLMQTILAMQRAMRSGVELLGYFHWSLTDNFEWDKGYWPRFGLYAVDYRTMERTPRPSAVWFAKVLKKVRGL